MFLTVINSNCSDMSLKASFGHPGGSYIHLRGYLAVGDLPVADALLLLTIARP
jgi:hypothetical protein